MKNDDFLEIEQSLEMLESALQARSPRLSPHLKTGLRAGLSEPVGPVGGGGHALYGVIVLPRPPMK